MPQRAVIALLLTLAGCATAPNPDAGGYRQIYSLAASNLCVTIDGTNTPVVNTCTSPDPGWNGQDEYYNSSNLQNPQTMNLTNNVPQLINMASLNSTDPNSGTWSAIITTTAPNDFGYTTVVSVPSGEGILITRVADSPNHPGSSSIFCLPQAQIQGNQITPGQRYPFCNLVGEANTVRRK